MDFIQFPPSHGYKYVLVMVCMFSHWFEAFPCRQATASSVAKILLEKIIPTWGTPLDLHSNWGIHFTGQVLQQVCAVWTVLQHFHCAYHPQSSGLVEQTNSIIKTQLAGVSLVAQWLRICLPMQGTWVRALVWEDPTCHGATKPVRHTY